MALRGRKKTEDPAPAPESVADYRFDAKRTNIPPAGLAAQGKLEEPRRIRYAYDPHRPPVLRFDGSGAADQLPELLATAGQRAHQGEQTGRCCKCEGEADHAEDRAGDRQRQGAGKDLAAQLEGKKDRQGVDHAQQAFGNMVVYATGRR